MVGELLFYQLDKVLIYSEFRLTLFFLTVLWDTIGMEIDYHVEPYKFTTESWTFFVSLSFFALSIAPFAYIVPILRNQPKN